jgi:hypothetical protein
VYLTTPRPMHSRKTNTAAPRAHGTESKPNLVTLAGRIDAARVVGLPIVANFGRPPIGKVTAAWTDENGGVHIEHDVPADALASLTRTPSPVDMTALGDCKTTPPPTPVPRRSKERNPDAKTGVFVPPQLGTHICARHQSPTSNSTGSPSTPAPPPTPSAPRGKFLLDKDFLLTHVTSTTGGRVWKKEWADAMGYWQPVCSFCDSMIEGNGGVGAHVSSPRLVGVGIVPCCRSCNQNTTKSAKLQATVRETTFVVVDDAEMDRIEGQQRSAALQRSQPPHNGKHRPRNAPTATRLLHPSSCGAAPSTDMEYKEAIRATVPLIGAPVAGSPAQPAPGVRTCARGACTVVVCAKAGCRGTSKKYCCAHCRCRPCTQARNGDA